MKEDIESAVEIGVTMVVMIGRSVMMGVMIERSVMMIVVIEELVVICAMISREKSFTYSIHQLE